MQLDKIKTTLYNPTELKTVPSKIHLMSVYLTGICNWCFSELIFLHSAATECWSYQTAKLVLQQLRGSAQWSLTGQRLERLDAMGWRVPGTHGITAHADIWTERAKYKYTGPGICRQRPHTHHFPHVFHKKRPHTSCNWCTLYVNWLTCRHFIQRDQTAQHLWEVQSQQQVAGLKRLRVREGTEGEHEPESHQKVHFPFKANH